MYNQRVNKASRKDQCPICSEWMSKDELRSCEVVVRQETDVGETVKLVLRLREHNSLVVCHSETKEEDWQVARYLRVEREYLLEKLLLEG